MSIKTDAFELACKETLEKRYNHVQFSLLGGSDATKGDIVVCQNNQYTFGIEVKLCPAQAGQFVVTCNGERFDFSEKNKQKKDGYTNQILHVLNTHVETYQNPTTKGTEIKTDPALILNWIKQYYKAKGNRFLMCGTEKDAFMAVVPIDQLDQFFSAKAVLRKKKSGSRYLTKDELPAAQIALREKLHTLGIKSTIEPYSWLKKNKEQHTLRFYMNEKIKKADKYFGEYFISERKNGECLVSKVGQTNNPTVIFSLHYIGEKTDRFHELDQELQKG